MTLHVWQLFTLHTTARKSNRTCWGQSCSTKSRCNIFFLVMSRFGRLTNRLMINFGVEILTIWSTEPGDDCPNFADDILKYNLLKILFPSNNSNHYNDVRIQSSFTFGWTSSVKCEYTCKYDHGHIRSRLQRGQWLFKMHILLINSL